MLKHANICGTIVGLLFGIGNGFVDQYADKFEKANRDFSVELDTTDGFSMDIHKRNFMEKLSENVTVVVENSGEFLYDCIDGFCYYVLGD